MIYYDIVWSCDHTTTTTTTTNNNNNNNYNSDSTYVNIDINHINVHINTIDANDINPLSSSRTPAAFGSGGRARGPHA